MIENIWKTWCTMSKKNKTVADIFNNLSDLQQEIAYEMIGQALEDGVYDREALVMFNKEEQMVIKFLLTKAMTFYI